MNKQKSYHHPPTNLNFFPHTNYFFSVQLGHPKLSGYGLLSTQALQNRSQKYSSVSQSGATAFPWRDPDPPAKHRFYPRLAPPYIRPPIRALIRAYPCPHPRRKCTEMRGSACGIKRAGADPRYPRSLLQSARGYRAIRVPRFPRLCLINAQRV